MEADGYFVSPEAESFTSGVDDDLLLTLVSGCELLCSCAAVCECDVQARPQLSANKLAHNWVFIMVFSVDQLPAVTVTTLILQSGDGL